MSTRSNVWEGGVSHSNGLQPIVIIVVFALLDDGHSARRLPLWHASSKPDLSNFNFNTRHIQLNASFAFQGPRCRVHAQACTAGVGQGLRDLVHPVDGQILDGASGFPSAPSNPPLRTIRELRRMTNPCSHQRQM